MRGLQRTGPAGSLFAIGGHAPYRRPEDAHRREPIDLAAPAPELHWSYNAPGPASPGPAGAVGGGADLASAAVCGTAGCRQAASATDSVSGAGAHRGDRRPRRPPFVTGLYGTSPYIRVPWRGGRRARRPKRI